MSIIRYTTVYTGQTSSFKEWVSHPVFKFQFCQNLKLNQTKVINCHRHGDFCLFESGSVKDFKFLLKIPPCQNQWKKILPLHRWKPLWGLAKIYDQTLLKKKPIDVHLRPPYVILPYFFFNILLLCKIDTLTPPWFECQILIDLKFKNWMRNRGFFF